jgi:Uma2 family endonuclease
MTQAIRTIPSKSPADDPVWEIAELLREQGDVSEEAYLKLSTNHLVEFDNGTIEVLPLPTRNHQLIAAFIYEVVKAFVVKYALGGKVFFAPYRLRVAAKKYREPEVFYLSSEQDAAASQQFTDHAELLVEVVSPDDPARDHVTKRAEYARAAIPEYWIVDPSAKRVIVLRLENDAYTEHGNFTAGQTVTSHRFGGLEVPVDDIFNSCM